MNVLIIDDNFHSRRFAQYMLGSLGCGVHTAPSGEVGLEVLKLEQIDFVFLDWDMPIMNGAETLRMLSREFSFAGIKIAIYSGFNFQEISIPKNLRTKICKFISKKSPPIKQFNDFKTCVNLISNTQMKRRSYG